MKSGLLFLLQICAIFFFLKIGIIALLIFGLLTVIAYTPFLFRDLLVNGTTGQKIYVFFMIFGISYVIYKILEAKQLL